MTFQSGDHSSHLYRNRRTFSSIFVYIYFKYSVWSSLKMLAPFLKGSIPLKYFSRPWEENSGTFRIKAIPISCFCSTKQLFPGGSLFCAQMFPWLVCGLCFGSCILTWMGPGPTWIRGHLSSSPLSSTATSASLREAQFLEDVYLWKGG